jgi:hypothetical protein
LATRIEIDADAEEMALAGWDVLAETRLGPDIAGDARRYAPKDTGALAESIEHHMEGHDLIVSATGGADGRVYAAYIELGHRVFHPSTSRTGPETVPPEPFLRPALFQVRGE